MPVNNLNNDIKNKQAEPHKPVIIMKLIILFVILFVPLSCFLIWGMNKTVKIAQRTSPGANTGSNNSGTKPEIETEKTDNYNFLAPIPAEQVGDINKVPKEKIDSLFDNLKK
jgi:hypothetical protein